MRFDLFPLSCKRDPRVLFIKSTSSLPEDKFARSSFVAKCDMLDRWEDVIGAFTEDGTLAGAILTTLSKRQPTVANLQLLHTFAAYRRKGVASALFNHSMAFSQEHARYFRVSSEPDAVQFYRACGLRFWGEQKSGTLLCMARIDDKSRLVFDDCDPTIQAAVSSGRRGGVVNRYPQAR